MNIHCTHYTPSKFVKSKTVDPGNEKCLTRNENNSLVSPFMKLALESLEAKLVCSSSIEFVGEKYPNITILMQDIRTETAESLPMYIHMYVNVYSYIHFYQE